MVVHVSYLILLCYFDVVGLCNKALIDIIQKNIFVH